MENASPTQNRRAPLINASHLEMGSDPGLTPLREYPGPSRQRSRKSSCIFPLNRTSSRALNTFVLLNTRRSPGLNKPGRSWNRWWEVFPEHRSKKSILDASLGSTECWAMRSFGRRKSKSDTGVDIGLALCYTRAVHMKADIHPTYNTQATVTCACGATYKGCSTF